VVDPSSINDLVDHDESTLDLVIHLEKPYLKAVQWRKLGDKFDLPHGMKRTSWEYVSFAIGHKWLCYKLGQHGENLNHEEMHLSRCATILRWINLVSSTSMDKFG